MGHVWDPVPGGFGVSTIFEEADNIFGKVCTLPGVDFLGRDVAPSRFQEGFDGLGNGILVERRHYLDFCRGGSHLLLGILGSFGWPGTTLGHLSTDGGQAIEHAVCGGGEVDDLGGCGACIFEHLPDLVPGQGEDGPHCRHEVLLLVGSVGGTWCSWSPKSDRNAFGDLDGNHPREDRI